MTDSPVVLLRIAALSIEQSSRLIDGGVEGAVADPQVALAIKAAAGSDVLGAAATKTRADEAVVRYLARMGGRATPYGLFAGTAVAAVGPTRDLQLADRTEHRVRTRVDIEALAGAVTAAIEPLPVTGWPLRTNPLARIDGDLLRFAKAGDASADVVTIRATPVIAKVLDSLGDQVRSGAEVIADLCAWHPGLTAEQVSPLLTQLVEAGLVERFTGLLEPGVEPSAVAVGLLRRAGADDQADALADLTHEAAGVHPWSPALDEIWDHSWRQAGKVVESLAEIGEADRFDHQLELGMSAAQLDRQTLDDLRSAVLRVQRINGTSPYDLEVGDPAGWVPELSLGHLRDRFRARYEDAEVPLLAAVDLESGILQPSGRQVSRLAAAAGITSDRPESDPSVSAAVLRVYRRSSWQTGPVDIADFPAADELTGRAVLAVLLDDYEGRYTSMLVGALGRSPFAMMARFALGRPDLLRLIDGQLQAERDDTRPQDDPDPIHAELVYGPGGRIGNVLVRPKVLPDVIALGGGGGGTLSLDRLMLRLDGDVFQLRDKESGRPVVVELNTAHNIDFAGLDPVYSILGRLAGGGGAGWTWSALDRLDHLPRVTCGSVIVAPEQWRLDAEQVRRVRDAADPGGRLREELGLSDQRRWLGTGGFDQILPIDLTSVRSVRAALARHRDGAGLRLVEMPQAEAPATVGPDGGHVTEAVVGLGRALRPARRPPGTDITYCPLIGARWVYVRYHCGQSSAEQVVVRAAALAAELRAEGAVDEWFFVRYAADGYHIRVRMRAAAAEHHDRVLAAATALGAELRAESLVGRIVVDDYVPEIGRYGGVEILQVAEDVFTTSSTGIATFLATRPSETERIFRGVADVLAWVGAVFDRPEEQLGFLQGCQSGLQVRFARTGNPHGKLLREHRVGLDATLAAYAPDPELVAAVERLATAVRESPAGHRLLPVVGSALHMHCNRLYAFDAVRLEYLTYEWAIRKIRERTARRDPR